MANNQYVNRVDYDGSTIIDITDTTAVASDVASGKYFYLASGEKVAGTSSGGGTEAGTVTQDAQGYLVLDDDAPSGRVTVEALSVTQNGTYTAPTGKAYSPVTVSVSGGGGGGNMSDPIRFFDYDGTLVASYSSVPSALPSVPTHTGLTNGTWNHTLQQVTTQFNAMGTCDVGSNYTTSSGKTEIDCVLLEGRLNPRLNFAVNGTVTVDWGDGSSTDTVTGISTKQNLSPALFHAYAQPGAYTITLTPASGTTYALYGGANAAYPILSKGSSTDLENRVYRNCVIAVRLGAGCDVGSHGCYYATSLEYVTIPSSSTVGPNTFQNCTSLKALAIPSGSTTLDTSTLYGSSMVKLVSIPSSVTSISNSALRGCIALSTVSIPSGVTSIADNALNGNNAFSKLVIPSSVASIGASAFAGCYGVAEYHFMSTTPPTLANTNAFSNIQSDCVIYVPKSANQTVLTEYQTANNWSTYASYMQEEPQ